MDSGATHAGVTHGVACEDFGGRGIDPEFWRRFAAQHWERAPLVLRQPLAEPFRPNTRPEPWDSTMEYGERRASGRHSGPLYAVLLPLPL